MGAVPAVGAMALLTTARSFTPPALQRRAKVIPSQGPLAQWRDAVGSTFLYTAANWGAVSWYLEVYLRATSAKALARLYDVTGGAAVTGSSVTDDNATDGLAAYTRLRSSALTLTDGHEYRVQFGVQDGGAGGFLGGKLVAI